MIFETKIVQIKKRNKYKKKLPLYGWFHPCYYCHTPTGTTHKFYIFHTIYVYYLCKDCNYISKKSKIYKDIIKRFKLPMPNFEEQ